MKHLSILSLALIASTSLMAHNDGIVTDSSGNTVMDGSGNCVIFGSPGSDACKPMHSDMAKDNMAPAAMAKMEPMAAEPAIKEVINLKGVTFKTGSDVIKTSSHNRLDISAQDLKDNSDLKVIVAGHTDNVGDTLRNLELSQKRAEAVRSYLIDKGVASSRLTARGYGDTEPSSTNDTAGGRAQNRRVELRILQ